MTRSLQRCPSRRLDVDHRDGAIYRPPQPVLVDQPVMGRTMVEPAGVEGTAVCVDPEGVAARSCPCREVEFVGLKHRVVQRVGVPVPVRLWVRIHGVRVGRAASREREPGIAEVSGSGVPAHPDSYCPGPVPREHGTHRWQVRGVVISPGTNHVCVSPADIQETDLGPGVAANPYIAFYLRVPGPGTLELKWLDDSGKTTVEAVPINVV